jgi:hypothetical protein
MRHALTALLLAVLAGCAGVPGGRPAAESPCARGGEASWDCQVERYHDVAQ